MDEVSLREANLAVGNPEGAPALECTATGPALKFSHDTVVCLGGAVAAASLDGADGLDGGLERSDGRGGRPVPWWEPFIVPAGATLAIGAIGGPGLRCYLAVRGGFDVPSYLGSASTFTLGRFGGHGGRALLAGDVLRARDVAAPDLAAPDLAAPADVPVQHRWTGGPRSCRTGRSGSPRDRTRHRSSSPGPASTSCTPAATPCTTTRRAPASGSSGRARRGPARTAARPGCTRPTSTMSPTRSGRSTSPGTRRSSSVPTGRASAGSSARRSSRAASCGRRGSSGPGTPCASCRCARRTPPRCATGARPPCSRAPAVTATTASWPAATAGRPGRVPRPWSTAATATTT